MMTTALLTEIQSNGSLLIVLMALSFLAMGLLTKRLLEVRTDSQRTLVVGSQNELIPVTATVAAIREDSPDIALSIDPSASIPVHTSYKGQFEIRPGVWAFEDGVPLAILLPHLERRRIPARD